MAGEKQNSVPTPDQLKLLNRRGFTAVLRKDGTVRYVPCDKAPKKPPRFSRAQLAWAQAQIDGSAHPRDGTVGRAATRLGIKETATLRLWLKKYHERPGLWDHPQAPATPAPAEPAAAVLPAAGGSGGAAAPL